MKRRIHAILMLFNPINLIGIGLLLVAAEFYVWALNGHSAEIKTHVATHLFQIVPAGIVLTALGFVFHKKFRR